MPFQGAPDTANVQAAKWFVENDPPRIQIHGVMPDLGVDGGFLVYPRVPAIRPAQVIGPCRPADDISTQVTPARFGMVQYVARVPVCMADDAIYQRPTSMVEGNITLGEMQNWYGYYGRMDTATGDPVFGGLLDLVAPPRIVDMGGAALSFPCLSRAYHLVTANNGKPTVIMSNARTLESYENLTRLSGLELEYLPWRWYCPATRAWKEERIPSFNGTPWLINDEMNAGVLPADRRIWFIVLGDDGGKGPTRGLTRIVPAGMELKPFIVRTTNGQPDFVNQTVNMTKDIWVTMPAGLALGSQGALSLLTNFEHVGECPGPVPA